MSRHIWKAFQKFSTVCTEWQQDESTFHSPQQLYFQALPENAVYSTAATTVHARQNNIVKWTINIFQVRYHVRTNHCSYTKIKILHIKKNTVRFTMLRNSLWSVVHQSTVTWGHLTSMKSKQALKRQALTMIKDAADHQQWELTH